MGFERFRQEMAAKDIARQQREQANKEAERVAEQQKADAQRQRDAVAKAENDRISAERQKALAFRQQSGILDKLREFRELVDKSAYPQLKEDDPDWRSTPSSVADRIVWDNRFVGRRRLSDRVGGGAVIGVIEESCTEKYLIAETFPDGTIYIRGNKLGAIFGIGSKRLTRVDWNQGGISRPDVFEEPIYGAYQNPSTRNYAYEHEYTIAFPGSDG